MTHYSVTLADGREFTIEADSEDTARQRGRDYGSRVVSVEAAETPADEDSDETPKLTGDALDERARELDIEGRGTMSADEKREAIAADEAQPDPDE